MNVSRSNPLPTESCIYLDSTGLLDDSKRARETTYSSVSSASWVPRTLFEISTILPEGRKLTSREKQLYSENVEKVLINLRINPAQDVINRLIEDGKLHMDIRIQLLGQQLLFVYRTGLRFSTQSSKWRICHRLPKRVEEEEEKRSCFEAAHCHLLPELKVQHVRKARSVPPNSWLYATWNITTLLPTEWNQTDTMLDGQNTNPASLRCEILDSVFNQAAQFNAESCENYYHDIIRRIATRIEKYLRECGNDSQYTLPLRCYREVLGDYIRQIGANVNMLAWVCIERSLETDQEVIAVQKRIWAMTREETIIGRNKSFAPHQESNISPDNLVRVPVPHTQAQIPALQEQVSAQAVLMPVLPLQPSPLVQLRPIPQLVAQFAMPAFIHTPQQQLQPKVYFNVKVHLEPQATKYYNYCLQDLTIKTIALRHWQAGGQSTIEFVPMKKRMKELIKQGFNICAPQHQENIITCLFAYFYPSF